MVVKNWILKPIWFQRGGCKCRLHLAQCVEIVGCIHLASPSCLPISWCRPVANQNVKFRFDVADKYCVSLPLAIGGG